MGWSWYDRKAARLQSSVRSDPPPMANYTDEQTRQAVVHTREDVVLLVSYLSSLNVQMQRLVLLGCAVLGVLVWKLVL
jgi:hypothetical protein